MKRTVHLLFDSPDRRVMLVVDESDPTGTTRLPPPPRLPADMTGTVRPGPCKVVELATRKRVA